MASNYRGRILETVKQGARANLDRHIMNVEILIGSHAGIAEHPDMMDTIEKELLEAAKYQDILDQLKNLGR